MEISKILGLASSLQVTYSQVQETEKGYLITAVISTVIKGRDVVLSGLGQGKTIANASSKSLEAALSLFDGIDFEFLSRTPAPEPEPTPISKPEPVAEIPTLALEPESGAEIPTPVPVTEPEPTSVTEPKPISVSEPESVAEISTPVPVTKPEPVTEISTPVPVTEPEPTSVSESESVAEISTPAADYMVLTTQEIIRLRWTIEQGKKYLEQVYGKKSRSLLSREQLQEFYQYLRAQPTPETVVSATVTPEPLPVAAASEPAPSAPQAVVQSQSPVEVNLSDLILFEPEVSTDFEKVIQVSNLAIKALGLSQDECKAECQRLYKKRSRTLLSDPELIEYTKGLPKNK